MLKYAFALAALLGLATTATAQNACDWGGMKSAPTNEPTQFTVVNDIHDRTARLFWIDFDGNPVLYAEIPPNGTHQQQTLKGHVWVSENSFGYCDVIFTTFNHLVVTIR